VRPRRSHPAPGHFRALLRIPSSREDARVKTCDFCGRTEEDDAETLTWTTAVENGRRRTFCDACSREHLRAMEGKLDSEWW
jgi:hypothetical protein